MSDYPKCTGEQMFIALSGPSQCEACDETATHLTTIAGHWKGQESVQERSMRMCGKHSRLAAEDISKFLWEWVTYSIDKQKRKGKP